MCVCVTLFAKKNKKVIKKSKNSTPKLTEGGSLEDVKNLIALFFLRVFPHIVEEPKTTFTWLEFTYTTMKYT